MERSPESGGSATIAAGCLIAGSVALLTCLMLFVNGSLVLAILTALEGQGPRWFRDPRVSQFLLFAVPVLLVVVQWKLIDYLRRKLRRRSHESV